MPVIYIADAEFAVAIKKLNAIFTGPWEQQDWVVKKEDGIEYIIRRESERVIENGN